MVPNISLYTEPTGLMYIILVILAPVLFISAVFYYDRKVLPFPLRMILAGVFITYIGILNYYSIF